MRIPAAARRLGDRIVARVPIPIAAGENRGMRWSLASAGSGYGSGRRAPQQMRAMSLLLRDGDVFWDVGAHHGFVVLLAARRVGRSGMVHAFEPDARNRWFLEQHLRWNGLSNVVIHDVAIADYDGESSFGGSGSSKTYSLGGGSSTVRVRTARTLIDGGTAGRPGFVKIDVEGAEADVLRGALPALQPTTRFLVAMHSRAAHDACTALLEAGNHHIVRSAELTKALAGGPWPGDPDLVAFGPAHPGVKSDSEKLRAIGY